VKKPVNLKFKAMEDSLAAPEIVYTDFAKFEAPEFLHACYQVLHR